MLGYYFRAWGPESLSALGFAQLRFAGLAWLLWGTSLTVCLAGSYFLNAYLGHYDGLFYENTAPNVAIYVVSVFLIIKSFAEPLACLSEDKQKLIQLFSKASFGIYLVHPMIMEAVEKGRWGFMLAPRMHPPALMILATTGAVYLLSLCAVLALQRIPYLKRIV